MEEVIIEYIIYLVESIGFVLYNIELFLFPKFHLIYKFICGVFNLYYMMMCDIDKLYDKYFFFVVGMFKIFAFVLPKDFKRILPKIFFSMSKRFLGLTAFRKFFRALNSYKRMIAKTELYLRTNLHLKKLRKWRRKVTRRWSWWLYFRRPKLIIWFVILLILLYFFFAKCIRMYFRSSFRLGYVVYPIQVTRATISILWFHWIHSWPDSFSDKGLFVKRLLKRFRALDEFLMNLKVLIRFSHAKAYKTGARFCYVVSKTWHYTDEAKKMQAKINRANKNVQNFKYREVFAARYKAYMEIYEKEQEVIKADSVLRRKKAKEELLPRIIDYKYDQDGNKIFTKRKL